MAEHLEKSYVISLLEKTEEIYRPLDDFTGEVLKSCIENIDKAPAADVAPVVHAKWIQHLDKDLDYYWSCSNCNGDDRIFDNYCPDCGAKMDLEPEWI